MSKISPWKRSLSGVVSTAMVLAQVPIAGASQPVYGTVRASGPAYVAGDSGSWSSVSSARPLLAGDRLKTEEKGYVLAELGSQGSIGLNPGAEVSTSGTAGAAVVGVQKGKVAFHLGDKSPLQVAVAGSTVRASGAADAVVEVGEHGATLTVENGAMQVATATGGRTVKAGERVALDQVAGAYGEKEQADEVPAPPPPAPEQEQGKKRKLGAAWILAGTGIAAVTAVVLGLTLSDGNGNDGCQHAPE